MRFFSSLYSCLKRGAKATLQFYPENTEQVRLYRMMNVGWGWIVLRQPHVCTLTPSSQAVLIASCASAVGFMGGLVVDYPNSSKAKK